MTSNSAAIAAAKGGPGGLAALEQSPGRFRRIVRFAHELGVAGVDEADAIEAIEAAIWADGALPADTPSQRRAWDVVRSRALEAFVATDSAIEVARHRVQNAAPAILWRMPPEAGLSDFVAKLQDAEPLVPAEKIERIARGVVTQFARAPVTQRRSHPLRRPNLFETIDTPPDPRRVALHARAKAMAAAAGVSIEPAVDVDDEVQRAERDAARQAAIDRVVAQRAAAEWLAIDHAERVAMWEARPVLATIDGEPVRQAAQKADMGIYISDEPTDAVGAAPMLDDALADDAQALEAKAYEVGTVRSISLGAALRRERLGVGIASTSGDPTPVDLWRRHETPEMPAGALPTVIERFAVSQAEVMGADPAGLAMSALVTCAAAIPDAIQLQVKQHDTSWRESTRLWVGLVGMPSTKKTPIVSAAMGPLRKIDAERAAHNELAMTAYLALPKKDRDVTKPPVQPRHVVEDATIEALQGVLKDSPHGVISSQDELSGWFGAMDKYSPGKGSAADRAFWLRSFNGGSYNVDRVVRGSSTIPNLSISLLGGIQPEALRKVAADSVDDGLIQRFIPVLLRPASVGCDAPQGRAVRDYEQLINRLVRARAPASGGNLGGTKVIMFSAAARAIREELETENVEHVRSLEAVSPKLAAHFGKLDGIYARLCLLWHCIECEGTEPAAEISAEVASRVAIFVRDYLRPSAIAFYAGMLGMSAGHEDLMSLAAYIVSDGLSEVSAREVQRSTRALRHVTADDARRLCEKLVSFSWLEPIEPRQKSSTPRWRVVPAVHVMFADRGRAETQRREIAREAIRSAFGA